jgi:hypothetical protein
MARLEVLVPEVAILRTRQHDMGNHVAILLDFAERAETAQNLMTAAINTLRDDADRREQRVMDAIKQHDRRDDDRFDSVGVRLNTLERELDVAEADILTGRTRETRWFERRTVIRAALIGLVATVAGGLMGSLFERLVAGGGH